MSSFKKLLFTIFKEQRGLFILMTLNFILGLVVFIYSVFTLRFESTAVKIGYGDIGGYRDGAWTEMIMYPVLAILLGVLSAFLGMRIFERHGGNSAKLFIGISMCLIVWTFITLLRLLGEG